MTPFLPPNLCSEAPRYRYATRQDGLPDSEEPVNELNHAMDAMRYLFSRVPAPRAASGNAISPAQPAGPIVPSPMLASGNRWATIVSW